MSNIVQGAALTPETPISGNAAEATPITGSASQGPVIINDYVIDLEEVADGVQLTVRKGSEVQTALIPMGSGGGGASSWKELQDKPVEMVGSDTLTWDGNTDGLESTDLAGDGSMLIYKISDSTPSIDYFSENTILTIMLDGEETQEYSTVVDTGNGALANTMAWFFIVLEDMEGPYGTMRKGLYFRAINNNTYAKSLTIPGYTGFTTEKIAASHLYQPDWNQTDESKPDYVKNKPFGEQTVAGDTLTWDGNTEGLVCEVDSFYKVSDAIVSMVDFANGGCYSSEVQGQSTSIEFTADDVTEVTSGVVMLPDSAVWCVSEEGVGVDIGDGLIFDETGIYFLMLPNGARVVSLTIPGYTGFTRTEIKKIDTKYLPEHLQFGDVKNVILAEQELAVEEGMCTAAISATIIPGDRLAIVYDGETYDCEVFLVYDSIAFGNASIAGQDEDTGEPFCGVYADGALMFIPADETSSSHTVQVLRLEYNKLPLEYYTAQTVLYVNGNDTYVYVDKNCTTKATYRYVERALNSGMIALHRCVNGLLTEVYIVCYVFTTDLKSWHLMPVANAGAGVEYHTAEYTPE